jgi:hypothetical protein
MLFRPRVREETSANQRPRLGSFQVSRQLITEVTYHMQFNLETRQIDRITQTGDA